MRVERIILIHFFLLHFSSFKWLPFSGDKHHECQRHCHLASMAIE
jgi:hypothetical protein